MMTHEQFLLQRLAQAASALSLAALHGQQNGLEFQETEFSFTAEELIISAAKDLSCVMAMALPDHVGPDRDDMKIRGSFEYRKYETSVRMGYTDPGMEMPEWARDGSPT